MVRDGVANVVFRLQELGFEPRKVGADAWESRCPAHRSADRALSITRSEHNHVLLECRSPQHCPHARIIGALGFTNDHACAETPDWMIGRLARVPIQPATMTSPHATDRDSAGAEVVKAPEASDGVSPPDEGGSSAVALTPSADGSHDAMPGQLEVRVEGDDMPSQALSPLPGSSLISSDSRIEPMLDSVLNFHELNLTLIGETGKTRERQSSVRVLTGLASGARLFRSADGHACAQVRVGDRLEVYGLRSAGFRDWLIDEYMNGQAEPPSSWAISRVVAMLEARARFTSDMPDVFIRVGQNKNSDDDGNADGDDPAYFLDLGDSRGRAVAIGQRGWSIVDRQGVHFRRPAGLLGLPVPARDGSIDRLRSYVNLTEPDFRLVVAWLTAALRPVGPYPVLVLNGEQSSGKSTLARILRLLIDPHACPVLALPSSTENLMATALNGWLLLYENISTIPGWLSDSICQLAFGGGFAGRTRFTDGERSDIYAQRPVILVGIDDFVLRGDLRDRAVFLHLPGISEKRRQTERAFWPAFRADYPGILGGVLDAIVGGLRELPSVNLTDLPRMADYAEWGEAISRGLGWGADTFIKIYKDNRKEATQILLDDSPVATVLIALARKGVDWSGKPQDLYNAVVKVAGHALGPRWPKTISQFGSELRRIAPQLRLHGIQISFGRRGSDRIVTLKAEGATPGSPSMVGPNAQESRGCDARPDYSGAQT